jgi:hypothetical protein
MFITQINAKNISNGVAGTGGGLIQYNILEHAWRNKSKLSITARYF